MSHTELRKQISDEIVKALKAGTPSWRRPWTATGEGGLPKNAATLARYSGINILLLEAARLQRGFGPAKYYGALAHELGHWSEPRLGWVGSYALGELRAEITACYLASEIGIPQSEDKTNSAAYLGHWLREMQGDPSLIFKIASAASQATDFILSFSRPEPVSPDVLAEVTAGSSTPDEPQ